jgi:hypothetical protein
VILQAAVQCLTLSDQHTSSCLKQLFGDASANPSAAPGHHYVFTFEHHHLSLAGYWLSACDFYRFTGDVPRLGGRQKRDHIRDIFELGDTA